jgi:hypothetical protein
MWDESGVETINNSFQIGRNHPMIQQRLKSLLERVARGEEVILLEQDKAVARLNFSLQIFILYND